MSKGRRFAEWLYGPLDDPYTWLVWACVLGALLSSGWRLTVIVVIELVTVAMRIWTRDVVAEQRRARGDR